MVNLRLWLYSFLGIHALLIGFFPFYIPVYLYSLGFPLSHVAIFVALTGLGFCLFLYVWDRWCRRLPLRFLIILSLSSELLLLTLFFQEKDSSFLVLAGLINGVFNCNFWIIQRLLFLETINPQNSGKKFGNFQIFVLIVLKVAIFIGGIVLEAAGFFSVFLLSAALSLIAAIYYLFSRSNVELAVIVRNAKPLSLKRIFTFRDDLNSLTIFIIDGIFLYLESYFWIISLFLIVNESFWRLGILVVALTLVFGLVFITIKNRIDHLPTEMMYTTGVFLYALSWVLRSLLTDEYHLALQLILLSFITFCTTLFRLTFNKRFFDNAKRTVAHEYIYIKSYFSQLFLLCFLIIPLFFSHLAGVEGILLSRTYLLAALGSVLYFCFRRNREEAEVKPTG